MNTLIEFFRKSLQENIITVIGFILSLGLAVKLIIDSKRKKDYVFWKKRAINLGIYSQEWERTDDIILQQLFDENKRLESENKILQKRHSEQSFTFLIIVIFTLLYVWFREKKRELGQSLRDIVSNKND